jgi:hypothetical protein
MEDNSTPKFSGLADPKCQCTPERICQRCQGDLFSGPKFREPWNDAVKKNNEVDKD